jgi:hypothetical protein
MAEYGWQSGDRLQFDGKRTSWLVRATACDGRYSIATASMFGHVWYTIIDTNEGIRGALNIIGGGMGISTTAGPDPQIDECVAMLEDRDDTWEISHRRRVPLNVTRVRHGA